MNCTIVRYKLIEYLNGHMSFRESRDVENHLRKCERCSEEHAGIRSIQDMMNLLPDIEASPGLKTRILERCHGEMADKMPGVILLHPVFPLL